MNNVQLIGNIGRDAEVTEFAASHKVSFSLATSEKYYDRNNNLVEETDWHNVVHFVKPDSKLPAFLVKGQKIAIIGKVRHRTWTKEDGTTGHAHEIQAKEIELLGSKQGEPKPKDDFEETTDNLPF